MASVVRNILLSLPLIYAPQINGSAKSLGFSYKIKSSLLYSDHLNRPDTSSDNVPFTDKFSSKRSDSSPNSRPGASFAAAKDPAARTLGLKRFFSWPSLRKRQHVGPAGGTSALMPRSSGAIRGKIKTSMAGQGRPLSGKAPY